MDAINGVLMKKERWRIHYDYKERCNDVWTISTCNKRGWNTDSASEGYGLPKKVAQWICDQLNASKEICPYVYDGYNWKKNT
jgi:hypothetical protein